MRTIVTALFMIGVITMIVGLWVEEKFAHGALDWFREK